MMWAPQWTVAGVPPPSPHQPIADRWPAEKAVLQPLPQAAPKHKARPIPSQNFEEACHFDRKMKIVPENGSCRSCPGTRAARLSAQGGPPTTVYFIDPSD